MKIKQTEILGTDFRFLKRFASILLKQTPTNAYYIIYFFKYFRKASSKIIINKGPNTRAWILSK